ncbi:hypothetical protein MMC17_005692 [Xylographa soralifera]|nr:hypothetical protein [Xylographa soralifera]
MVKSQSRQDPKSSLSNQESEPDMSKPAVAKPKDPTPDDPGSDKPKPDDPEPTQAAPAAISNPFKPQDKPESMARNDFSLQSTEASVSRGYAEWSVAVSAGFASSKSSSTKDKINLHEKTFIARHMFPKCDLFFIQVTSKR